MKDSAWRPTMRWALLLLTLLASGCATNGYSEFYSNAPGITPEIVAATRSGPPPAQPVIAYAPGFDGLVDAYGRKGYAPIGHSSFSSGHSEGDGDAVAQARKVGADIVVIIDPAYAGSNTTSVPITVPTTSTSQTSATATAYGTDGTATAYGNSTTTTYGTRTSYVPMTVHRYEYGAVYFVKIRYSLGAQFRDLTDDERRQLQSNRGAVVTAVIDGSPAYVSDVIPGDIIVALNGQAANGHDGLMSLLMANTGRTVELTVIREGRPLTKSVALRQY
jgi:membrane-associated protease RseP (regulator of RpoE activity)